MKQPAALIVGIILSLCSGLAMAMAVYGAALPWLALFAWVPAIVAQHGILPDRYRFLGMTLAWFSYLGLAIVPALQPEIGPWAWLLPIGVGLLAGLLSRSEPDDCRQSGYRYFWWSGAVSFTAVEFGRTFIPAQGTWSLAGYALTEAAAWRHAAGYVGLLGLCLVVWGANYGLAQVVLGLLGRGPRRGAALYSGALFALLALGFTFFPAPPPAEGRPTLKVAVFQVGYDLYQGLWNERRLQGDSEGLSRDLFAEGARYTRQAAQEGARLVVWPEGFLRLVPQDSPEWKERVEALARETDAALAVGYVVETPDGRRNEVAIVTPDARWHVTGKDHPVPWAETGSVTRGQIAVAEIDGHRVGAMICYDADFTDTARKRAGESISLLVAPAHDWVAIGRSRLLHVRTRAAENHLPIVMGDWMVGSAMVDETGQVLASLPTDKATPGLLVSEVPLGSGQTTPYGRLGDLAGWAAIGLMLLQIILVQRAKRKAAAPLAR